VDGAGCNVLIKWGMFMFNWYKLPIKYLADILNLWNTKSTRR